VNDDDTDRLIQRLERQEGCPRRFVPVIECALTTRRGTIAAWQSKAVAAYESSRTKLHAALFGAYMRVTSELRKIRP
jgi:hypothetical protein